MNGRSFLIKALAAEAANCLRTSASKEAVQFSVWNSASAENPQNLRMMNFGCSPVGQLLMHWWVRWRLTKSPHPKNSDTKILPRVLSSPSGATSRDQRTATRVLPSSSSYLSCSLLFIYVKLGGGANDVVHWKHLVRDAFLPAFRCSTFKDTQARW